LVIRLSLLLLLSALAVFLLVDVLLRLSVPVLPDTLNPLGIALLFSAFFLLLATGLLRVSKLIAKAVFDYFSTRQRMQRRLLFIEQKQKEITLLFHLKTAKVTYLAELKRKRLLTKNNQKHLFLLSKTIGQDLLAIKKHIPESQFKQLQADHIRYKNDQDIAALLKLQQQIASITQA
jgi:hypothetical protein